MSFWRSWWTTFRVNESLEGWAAFSTFRYLLTKLRWWIWRRAIAHGILLALNRSYAGPAARRHSPLSTSG